MLLTGIYKIPPNGTSDPLGRVRAETGTWLKEFYMNRSPEKLYQQTDGELVYKILPLSASCGGMLLQQRATDGSQKQRYLASLSGSLKGTISPVPVSVRWLSSQRLGHRIQLEVAHDSRLGNRTNWSHFVRCYVIKNFILFVCHKFLGSKYVIPLHLLDMLNNQSYSGDLCSPLLSPPRGAAVVVFVKACVLPLGSPRLKIPVLFFQQSLGTSNPI
jgi:hypothetical protein